MSGRPALVLGSGIWHVLAEGGGLALTGGAAAETPFGPSMPLYEARLGRHECLVITRHGAEGYRVGAWNTNYRANLWALKERGADRILASSACGGIDPALAVGTFVVPHDILDRTTARPRTFFERSGLGVLRHRDPFCPAARAALASALEEAGHPHAVGGVYVCTDGPRLETPAEIRSFAAAGASLVGMTVAPEFALARELEICYAPLCFVVNPAEGVVDRPYQPDVLFEGMASPAEARAADEAASRVPAVFERALDRLSADRPCHCRRAMERYRRRGDIGDDFRTWV